MTIEELKEHCKKQIKMCEMWAKAKGENPCGKIYEEHKLILELLEQAPCEDCISRQAVLKTMCDASIPIIYEGKPSFVVDYVGVIETVPSVTPQPEIGHWINIDATHSKCNRCGAVFEIASENGEANYCPHCGAKMQEEEENDD